MKFFSHFLPSPNVTLRLGKIIKLGECILPNCIPTPFPINCPTISPILSHPQRRFYFLRLITHLRHITFAKKTKKKIK